MTPTRKIPVIVSTFFAMSVILSLAQLQFSFWVYPLNKFNLLGKVVIIQPKVKKPTHHLASISPVLTAKNVTNKNHNHWLLKAYSKKNVIMRFGSDTLIPSLSPVMRKLYALKHGTQEKIRIAYLGDSMIEADLISGTLRMLLQKEFGGSGVGFVPVNAVAASSRTTVSQSSEGWKEQNFKTLHGRDKTLFISGRKFAGEFGKFHIIDRTLPLNNKQPIEKSLLCSAGTATLTVDNNGQHSISPSEPFNRIVLKRDTKKEFDLEVKEHDPLPVFGVTFESANGIFVDNFSFRGISGSELSTLNTTLLNSVDHQNHYDLIILQYGVNELFNPELTAFDWYAKVITPAIRHLQSCFPGSDFLLISSGDRAFRYDGEYRTALGLEALVRTQARIAAKTNCAFYNLYQTMGGQGSMAKWVNASPPMAYRDYVHPNSIGAAILGKRLYNALLSDYQKFTPGKP